MLRRGGRLIPDSTRASRPPGSPGPTAASAVEPQRRPIVDPNPVGQLAFLPRSLDKLRPDQPAEQALGHRIGQRGRVDIPMCRRESATLNLPNGTQLRAVASLPTNWTWASSPFRRTRQASDGPSGRAGIPISARSPSTTFPSSAFLSSRGLRLAGGVRTADLEQDPSRLPFRDRVEMRRRNPGPGSARSDWPSPATGWRSSPSPAPPPRSTSRAARPSWPPSGPPAASAPSAPAGCR